MNKQKVNPFFLFWIRPIYTLELMLSYAPKPLLGLLALGGACFYILPQIGHLIIDSWSRVFGMTFLAILGLFFLFVYIVPLLLYGISKSFSAPASFFEFCIAHLWSLWPLTCSFIIQVILLIVTLGKGMPYISRLIYLIGIGWYIGVNISFIQYVNRISWLFAFTLFFLMITSLLLLGTGLMLMFYVL